MTTATGIFSTALLALLLIGAASSAHAGEAAVPHAGEAVVSMDGGPVAANYLLAQSSGNALLPVHGGIEEIAADERAQNIDDSGDRAWRKRWMISLAPLVASQALDASSSWGLRELNPALAGSDGRFGMKAAGIKFGVIGGLVGVEYLLVKKFPASAKFFSVVNYSTAAITTGLAVHNYMLPGR